jgi:hypothetical protein
MSASSTDRAANGTVAPIDAKVSVAPANDHTITFNVGGVTAANTTYYFRITHHDPNNIRPDLVNSSPLPSFFTGAQAIGTVSVEPAMTGASMSWTANVIGHGRVDRQRDRPRPRRDPLPRGARPVRRQPERLDRRLFPSLTCERIAPAIPGFKRAPIDREETTDGIADPR